MKTPTLVARALKGFSSDHRPVVITWLGDDIVTYNAGNASDAKVLADLRQLLALKPLAIGLQEVADRRPVLAKAAKEAGYAHIQFGGPVKGHVALLVRGDANPRNIRLHQISPHTKLDKHDAEDIPGGRKGSIPTKYILAVDVTEDGEDRTVAVMHLTPGASHNEAARRLLGIQGENAGAWLGGEPLWTDLMGDCNGRAGRPEFAALRKVATPHSAPSRKGSAIDIHWVKAARRAKPHPQPARHPKPTLPHPHNQEKPVSVNQLVNIAEAQVGYHEGRSGGHWNNDEKYAAQVPGLAWANRQPWCDVFVNWCYFKAGMLDLVPVVSAGCDISAAGWKKAGRWSEYPAIGAQVFYGKPSDLVHTGLVIDYDDDTITTIEGNTNDSGSAEGDGVYRKTRQRRDPFVVGYGLPKFDEGIKSADPAFRHEAPKRRPNRPKKPKPAPQPAPAERPFHEGQAIDETRTVVRNAAKAGNKRRASKWRQILDTMLGRSK